jgi:hypothetical protein
MSSRMLGPNKACWVLAVATLEQPCPFLSFLPDPAGIAKLDDIVSLVSINYYYYYYMEYVIEVLVLSKHIERTVPREGI